MRFVSHYSNMSESVRTQCKKKKNICYKLFAIKIPLGGVKHVAWLCDIRPLYLH